MIKYPNRIKQVLDFRGIGNSKIHPTDIDAILEFDNKYLIMFEVKKKGVEAPLGQVLLFERLADCWEKTRGPAWVIYCEHDTNTDEIVHMQNCFTSKVYRDNVYYKYKDHSIREVLQDIAYKYNITKLKDSL